MWNGVKCWNFMTEKALNTIKGQLQCFFRSNGCHLSFEKNTWKDQEWNDTDKGTRVSFLTLRKSRKKKNAVAAADNFDEVIRKFRPIYICYVVTQEHSRLWNLLCPSSENTQLSGESRRHMTAIWLAQPANSPSVINVPHRSMQQEFAVHTLRATCVVNVAYILSFRNDI
jgi:hypothetical protein